MSFLANKIGKTCHESTVIFHTIIFFSFRHRHLIREHTLHTIVASIQFHYISTFQAYWSRSVQRSQHCDYRRCRHAIHRTEWKQFLQSQEIIGRNFVILSLMNLNSICCVMSRSMRRLKCWANFKFLTMANIRNSFESQLHPHKNVSSSHFWNNSARADVDCCCWLPTESRSEPRKFELSKVGKRIETN